MPTPARRSPTALLVVLCLAACTVLLSGQETRREYHVSPSGLSNQAGTPGAPLDLATALSSRSPARPGDTIWLHQGTYRGSFISDLAGTAAAPIVVRQYPGERATLDSNGSTVDALTARGGYVWFWGFEIMSSAPARVSAQSGSWPSDLQRGYGAVTRAPGIRFINLVLHDNANGIGLWTEAVGSEAYGNLIYFNGWEAPDRAHGHGIYTQNASGLRRIAENILFDQFSHGIHAYGSESAWLDRITLQGNVAFMNGSLSAGGIYESGRELLLGGYRTAASPVIDGNATWGGQSNFGYSAGCTNGRVTNNYFAGAVILVNCDPVTTGNVFYDASWPRYGSWPTEYPQNTYHGTRPTTPVVLVRPNAYEPGRANIVIYNWTRAAQVSVDLRTAGLPEGTAFELRDAQNFFGPPVVIGLYDGRPISVPMSGLTAARPVGAVPSAPVHTAPEFGAFILLPIALDPIGPPGNSSPSVTLTSPAAGTRLTAPASILLSATSTDPDGSIVSTAFYRDDVLIGVDTTQPYTAAWTATTAGQYSLTAVATDNRGASTTSSAISITVTAGPPPPGAPSHVRIVGR